MSERPNLLLVDDTPWSNRLGGELAKLGWEAAPISDLDAALALVRNGENWLAAIEPCLGGSPWFQVLERWAQEPGRPPFLVVTDFPSVAMTVHAMRLGALDVIPKPHTASDLAAAIAGACPAGPALQATDLSLSVHEWEHINRVLFMCSGNITRAALLLGISRQSLYNKLRKRPPGPPRQPTPDRC
jgi:two-component system, response regulator RegA